MGDGDSSCMNESRPVTAGCGQDQKKGTGPDAWGTEPEGVRLAGIIPESVTDGPGIRLSIFVQGCLRKCPGCQNPQTHDLSGGSFLSMDEFKTMIRDQLAGDPLISGVTFSGGEPMLQAPALAELAREVIKPLGLDLMVYTGYKYEELTGADQGKCIAGCDAGNQYGVLDYDAAAKLLSLADRLVDGPFLLAEKDLTLKYRGSRNQRYIDLAASGKNGSPVLFGLDEWDSIV